MLISEKAQPKKKGEGGISKAKNAVKADKLLANSDKIVEAPACRPAAPALADPDKIKITMARNSKHLDKAL